MDLLSDVLAVSGVRGTVGARVEAGESWAVWRPSDPGAAFHAVTAGVAWVGLPGRPPIRLMPGDVVLLPTGTEHSLSGDPDASAGPHEDAEITREDGGVYRVGSGPVRTRILCAHYEHDPAVSNRVLASLPEVVHVRADNGGGGLDDTVRLLSRELAHPRLATDLVLDSLVDVLLVQLLRAWLASEPDPSGCTWLGVFGDPVIAGALAKLHGDPARAWTTAAPAKEKGVYPGDPGAAVPRRRRPDPRGLPHQMAHGPRGAAAQEHRRHPGGCRPLRRVHLRLRFQPGVQARPFPAARPVPRHLPGPGRVPRP